MSERDDDEDDIYNMDKHASDEFYEDELLKQLIEEEDGINANNRRSSSRHQAMLDMHRSPRRSSGVSRLNIDAFSASTALQFGPSSSSTNTRLSFGPSDATKHAATAAAAPDPNADARPTPMIVGTAMPLHYPSDTDSFLKSRRLDMPSFTVTSYSDSYVLVLRAILLFRLLTSDIILFMFLVIDRGSPPRNRFPGSRPPMQPMLTPAHGRGPAGSVVAATPTPLKVLRTNINPYSPDARKHKQQKMKVPDDGSTPRFVTDYEVVEVLGGGSFGKVFKVRHRTDGWIYALKKVTYKNPTERYAFALSSFLV